MLANCKENQNNQIESIFIQKNISLADKNTFRTGGNAEFFAEPTTAAAFSQALQFARENNLEVFVLGGGANILISDAGFNGLVIRPALTEFTILEESRSEHDCNLSALSPAAQAYVQQATEQETSINNRDNSVLVKAGAGISIDNLIQQCFDHQIIGLEEFSGIPGNVGGAVYINLHYYEFLLEQFLASATLIKKSTGEIITVDTAWFKFGYDQSRLQEKEYFVIDATFKLKKALDAFAVAFARGRSVEITRHRQKRYPYQHTCGSFFRNFHPEEVINTEKKLIFVAYYLDQLGVKGSLSVGKAIVSHQHANMIVAQPGATSTDVINLTKLMQQMVYNKYQIMPQPECQLVGFHTNPFL